MLTAITIEEAQTFLMQDRDQHLMHLGALRYDPVQAMVAVVEHSQVKALALLVTEAGALPDPKPTMLIATHDPAMIEPLLAWRERPERCVLAVADPRLAMRLEQLLQARTAPMRGLAYYGAEHATTHVPLTLRPPPTPSGMIVRRLHELDCTELDLLPCGLSSTALRGWLRLGWRVFGAIEGSTLLAHALAAYPLGESDEVAALYTAGRARRRGIGSAVVTAVIDDSRARGRRAFYVASRHNRASRQLAEQLGLRLLTETYEIVLG
jgi:GNAT superfamily N-acetyltransferase